MYSLPAKEHYPHKPPLFSVGLDLQLIGGGQNYSLAWL
jgi:hypothetical protein